MIRALCLAFLIAQAIDLTSCNGKRQLALVASTSSDRAVQAVGKSVKALREIASIGWLYGHTAPAELAESTANSVTKILAAATSKPIDPGVTAEQSAGLAFVKSRTAVQQAGLAAEAAVKANEHMQNIASVWAVEAKNGLREAAAAAKQTERALKRLIPQNSGRQTQHQAPAAPRAALPTAIRPAIQAAPRPAIPAAARPLVPGATRVGVGRGAVNPAPNTNLGSQSLGGFFEAMRKQVKQQLQPRNNRGNDFQALQALLSQLALLENHRNVNNRGFFTD